MNDPAGEEQLSLSTQAFHFRLGPSSIALRITFHPEVCSVSLAETETMISFPPVAVAERIVTRPSDVFVPLVSVGPGTASPDGVTRVAETVLSVGYHTSTTALWASPVGPQPTREEFAGLRDPVTCTSLSASFPAATVTTTPCALRSSRTSSRGLVSSWLPMFPPKLRLITSLIPSA